MTAREDRAATMLVSEVEPAVGFPSYAIDVARRDAQIAEDVVVHGRHSLMVQPVAMHSAPGAKDGAH